MIGGGPGAFIGAVHRRAVELDGDAELVAGVFSSNPEKSKQQGRSLLLDPDRRCFRLELKPKIDIVDRVELARPS